MTTEKSQPDLAPMSKHHVLHLAGVSAKLPSHLFRPLLVLAVHADHRTGLSRPGRRVFETDWGIPYSSWHRQMQQLAALGLIRQVVKGDKRAGLAATYELLYVPALTDESASSSSGSGDPSPHRGGGSIHESGRPGDPVLTEYEVSVWNDLRDEICRGMTQNEYDRLNAHLADFDHLTRLRRTCVRLIARGARSELVDVLTARTRPERRPYDGVRNVPAAMWARVRPVANAHGIDMADRTPVEESSAVRVKAAAGARKRIEEVIGRPLVVGGGRERHHR
jgi:hypothetical protein